MLKARGEILERLEKLDNVSEGTLDKIVAGVLANYRGARDVTSAELAELAADVRKHWRALQPLIRPPKKPVGKSRRTASRRRNTKKS